eukprot:COSAG01_NODE_8684_length_2697_cov_8.200154_3_plen_76_part_00
MAEGLRVNSCRWHATAATAAAAAAAQPRAWARVRAWVAEGAWMLRSKGGRRTACPAAARCSLTPPPAQTLSAHSD